MADGRGPGGELQGSPAAPEADLFGEDGEAEARVPMWTPATFIPPLNFGMVEEGVYRSGAPNELNFPFLEQLHLKTILYLAPDDPDQQFVNFADDQDITLLHIGGEDAKRKSWSGVSEETVLTALQALLDVKRFPVIVMCYLGRHRTGTVVGCLRKLQRWNLTSIFEEYRRYAGSKVRLMSEQFIELFDTDLVPVLSAPPPWL